jgi:hypothetical protein
VISSNLEAQSSQGNLGAKAQKLEKIAAASPGQPWLRGAIPPGKRRSTLCGYLAGCLVLRVQRSNGQTPGYQARTFPPPRQRIAYRVQALGGSGKAFGCFLKLPVLQRLHLASPDFVAAGLSRVEGTSGVCQEKKKKEGSS